MTRANRLITCGRSTGRPPRGARPPMLGLPGEIGVDGFRRTTCTEPGAVQPRTSLSMGPARDLTVSGRTRLLTCRSDGQLHCRKGFRSLNPSSTLCCGGKPSQPESLFGVASRSGGGTLGKAGARRRAAQRRDDQHETTLVNARTSTRPTRRDGDHGRRRDGRPAPRRRRARRPGVGGDRLDDARRERQSGAASRDPRRDRQPLRPGERHAAVGRAGAGDQAEHLRADARGRQAAADR